MKKIKRFFKRLFCKHDYEKEYYDWVILHKCKKCGYEWNEEIYFGDC